MLPVQPAQPSLPVMLLEIPIVRVVTVAAPVLLHLLLHLSRLVPPAVLPVPPKPPVESHSMIPVLTTLADHLPAPSFAPVEQQAFAVMHQQITTVPARHQAHLTIPVLPVHNQLPPPE